MGSDRTGNRPGLGHYVARILPPRSRAGSMRTTVEALRLALLPLLATGLLAAPGTRQAGRAGDDPTPIWRSVQHGPEAVALDWRAEALSAQPPDEDVPGTTCAGDVPPSPAASAQRWRACGCDEASGSFGGVVDERIALAQSHRRVNGSANAHGARA